MEERGFNFKLQHKSYPAFEAASTKSFFEKWGFTRWGLQTYTYDNFFDHNTRDKFVHQFFSHPEVKRTFKIYDSSDTVVNMEGLVFEKVDSQLVPATITNMDFFNPLYTNSVVRQNGDICKCFDEVVEEFLISDELRRLILSAESSEFSCAFSPSDRGELLFLLISHLVLGGYCCQYEDNVKPYLETTKYLYKDLLNVRKDKSTGKLYVSCTVIRVRLLDADGVIVFPGRSNNRQNFCYMIVDPEARQMTVWYHVFSL